MRLEILKPLKILYEIANLNPPIPESPVASALLNDYQKDSHQYAAAIRANLKDGFRYILK